MSYNGIGLTTVRGSGTNGYVQRNLSAVRRIRDHVGMKSEEEMAKLDSRMEKKPNAELLQHDLKRRVEVKCMELQDLMEEQGYPEQEIKKKVDSYRQMLSENQESLPGKEDSAGRPIVTETHQIAEMKERENENIRAAFGIRKDYVKGSAFDKVGMTEKRAVEENVQRYDVIRSPSRSPPKAEQTKDSRRHKPAEEKQHKPKKQKRKIDTSSSESESDSSESDNKRKMKHSQRKKSVGKSEKRSDEQAVRRYDRARSPSLSSPREKQLQHSKKHKAKKQERKRTPSSSESESDSSESEIGRKAKHSKRKSISITKKRTVYTARKYDKVRSPSRSPPREKQLKYSKKHRPVEEEQYKPKKQKRTKRDTSSSESESDSSESEIERRIKYSQKKKSVGKTEKRSFEKTARKYNRVRSPSLSPPREKQPKHSKRHRPKKQKRRKRSTSSSESESDSSESEIERKMKHSKKKKMKASSYSEDSVDSDLDVYSNSKKKVKSFSPANHRSHRSSETLRDGRNDARKNKSSTSRTVSKHSRRS